MLLLIAETKAGNHIQAIDFDNRGKTLLTGGTDLSIREYDAATHQVRMSYTHAVYVDMLFFRKSNVMSLCTHITP